MTIDIDIIKNNVYLLKFIDNQTDELCKSALKYNGLGLEYIKNKTYELSLIAVEQNGLALEYVNPDDNYKLALNAVKQNPYAIKFVNFNLDLDINIFLEVVKKNGRLLNYIPNKYYNYNIYLEAIKSDSYALEHINDQTYELCLLAVSKCGTVLKFVKEQTYDICLAAINNYALSLQYVKIQIEFPNLCLIAVKKNKYAIAYVDVINNDLLNYLKTIYSDDKLNEIINKKKLIKLI
jgi:hypothetical protein